MKKHGQACRVLADSAEEARRILEQKGNFDYVNGRYFKVTLAGTLLQPMGL